MECANNERIEPRSRMSGAEINAMEETKKPFFTIITSTLNVINTIERCVQSVASQTFCDYEHIIVDGASTDGTVEFLNSRREFFSVLISEPDTGIYNAWNKALKHARGEWLLFLGADDILADDNVLNDAAAYIKEHEAMSGVVYGDVTLVTKNNFQERALIQVFPEDIGKNRPGEMRPLLPCHSGIFHHKNLFTRYGFFDESYRICADAKLLIKALCMSKEPALHIPRVLYKMTMGGVSSAIGVQAFHEEYRLMNELNLSYSRWARFSMYVKVYIKQFIRSCFGEKISYQFVDFIRFLQGKPRLWR